MSGETHSRGRDAVLDVYGRHFGRGRARIAKIFGAQLELSSSGSIVRGEEESFLDCAGLGVFLLGHCHPRIVDAVAAQLRRHPLSTRMLLDPVLADAAEALAAIAPPDLEYVHFVSSGTEAVETAIKLARLRGARRLIGMQGGFHGKTLGALSVMGRAHYREPFEPLLAASFVPFGDALALEQELAQGASACVVVEPIQGEGGVNIPPPGYLQDVAQKCRKHGAVLVLDEILTGLGRVGSWWAADREEVIPDVLLAGKALSGGVMPVAAALATAELYEPLARDPLLHTSTFGGAPLAAAAVKATIETIEVEGLIDRANQLGGSILQTLEVLAQSEAGHLIGGIRGAGLLLGIEFVNQLAAGEFTLQMLSQGILVNHSFNASRVIRLTPPAVMSEEELQWLLRGLSSSIKALADTYPGKPEGNSQWAPSL
jgi:putrescine aminotransferase